MRYGEFPSSGKTILRLPFWGFRRVAGLRGVVGVNGSVRGEDAPAESPKWLIRWLKNAVCSQDAVWAARGTVRSGGVGANLELAHQKHRQVSRHRSYCLNTRGRSFCSGVKRKTGKH